MREDAKTSRFALAALLLFAGRAVATPVPAPLRLPVDPDAMREASHAGESSPRFFSPEALRHYVEGSLAAEAGDHAEAIQQLREALVFDEGAVHPRVRLGLEYVRSGQPESGERTLREAVAESPRDPEAREALGELLLQTDRPRQAVEELERAVELAPGRGDGWRALAQALLRIGDERRLEAALDGWARHVPGDLGWREYGEALVEHGDAQEAERYLRRALEFAPEDPGALAALGRLADLRHDDEAALRLYERSVRSDPDDGGVLIELGQHYLRRAARAADPAADRGRARACFDGVVAGASDEAPARAEVGLAYAQAHLFPEALAQLSAAVAAEPEAPRWRYYRGLVQLQSGAPRDAAQDLALVPFGDELWVDAQAKLGIALVRARRGAEAEARLRVALERMPGALPLTLGLATVLREEGKGRSSTSMLERALERSGPSPELVAALARSYEEAGRAADALSLLRAGLGVRPDDETLLFELGSALGREGRTAEALAVMRRVVGIDSGNAEALNYVGFTLAERGEDLPEAEGLVRRALDLEPDDGLIADSLGWVYFKEGRFELAVETLARADRAAPGEPVILGHLGDACAKAGDRARAAESYARALRALAPGSAPGLRAAIEQKLRELKERTASAGQR